MLPTQNDCPLPNAEFNTPMNAADKKAEEVDSLVSAPKAVEKKASSDHKRTLDVSVSCHRLNKY